LHIGYDFILNSKHEANTLIGYIDAHSGIICFTEPRALTFSSDITAKEIKSNSNITHIPTPVPSPANSTFVTRYSGTKFNVETDYRSGLYYLEDWTRGNGIETLDLENKLVDYIGEALSISNNDNYWDSTDFEDEFGNAALDVHWGLQAVYNYYSDEHAREGWDSAGQKVNAYVNTVTEEGTDCAFYDPTYEVLGFGDGLIKFKPVVALDVVAHEYAHGINGHTSGFGDSGLSRSFNEALSDIWAAIIEDYLAPNDPNWLIGDKVMKLDYDCLRNLEDPDDEGAYRDMADTYGSEGYYGNSNEYFRSGPMSHFFYLLCNGGSGENGLGNDYQVYKLDLDDAADLIYFAQAERYLNGASTYPLMGTYMLNASDDHFVYSDLESMQVANAWYAVGIGSEPSQIGITGSTSIYPYGIKFTLDNLPDDCDVLWECSSNISLSNATSNPVVASSNGSDEGWIKATVSSEYTDIELDKVNVTVYSSNPYITGSSLVCSSGATFGLSAACSYDSIKWIAGPYLTITSGQGTSSCTFAATGNGSSDINVTLYVNGNGTSLSEKDVWAGKPIFNFIIGPDWGYTGIPYTYQANPYRNPLSQSEYDWMVVPPYYYFVHYYYDLVTIVFSDPYDYYQVLGRAVNSCGPTNWRVKNVVIYSGFYFSISPNPASDFVTVTIFEPASDEITTEQEILSDYKVSIFDSKGIYYYSGIKSESSFTLPVRNLRDGNYIINISKGKKTKSLQLIIKH
jgi:Zn-dependent metalloprotease